MRCKPGDLAVIVHPRLAGKLVEVIHAAPAGHSFYLPNGVWHSRAIASDWVIKALGAPFDVRRPSGAFTNEYACCEDRWLRSIRGEPEPASIDTPITEPAEA